MAEKRLIDANALLEVISTLTLHVMGLRAGKRLLSEFMVKYREGVLRIVEEAPTVDAVEVCRCKDCYWWNTERKGINGECVCNRFSMFKHYSNLTLPTDFCSYGERRTDG